MSLNFISPRWERYKTTKRWWSILLDFIFLLLIVAMILPGTRRSVSAFVARHTLLAPRESGRVIFLPGEALAYQLVNDEGKRLKLAELLDKPIFLNFWSIRYPSCIAELPGMQNLHDRFREEVNFVFVSNDARQEVKAFMARGGFNLPQFTHYEVPQVFNTSFLPTTFIIDTNARVVMQNTGAAQWYSRKVIQLLDSLTRY